MNHLWLGDRFSHSTEPSTSILQHKYGFRKSIVPTKTTFHVGLHMSGACHLEYPWNGCEKNATGFCYAAPHRDENMTDVLPKNTFYHTHSFIDKVRNADVKKIDTDNEGVLYHILHFPFYQVVSKETDLTKKNEYATKFFPRIHQALKKRRLDLLIDIPAAGVRIPNVHDSWLAYELIYLTRNTLGDLFPSNEKLLRA